MKHLAGSIYKIITGMSSFRPVDVAGIDVSFWVDLFNGCHTKGGFGAMQIAWPDGRSYLEQDNITVQMFRMIQEQIDKANTNE